MTTLNNRVVKNAAWIIGIRVIQSVIQFVISMLTARYLGPSTYGLINYAASLVAFVLPIMQLGLPGILVQEIVNEPEQEGAILGTSLGLSLTSAVACMIGMASFVSIANPDEKVTKIVCALYSLILIAQAGEMIQYWFQAKLASKYVSITSLFAYIIVSAYKIYLLIMQKSIYWFAVSNALDYGIIGITLLFIYRKLSDSKLKFSWKISKRLLKKSRHYIISGMMVTVFAQTAQIMLKLMMGAAEVSYYALAVSCAGITSFVFSAIIDSMRPMIFESKKINQEQYEKNISRLYCLIIYLSLAQSIIVTVLAPWLISGLYGSEYQSAAMILQVLIWYTTFSYLGAARNVWILAENKQKYLWMINLSGAVVNVVLNMIFIPILGGIGAAITALVTQIFTNVITGFIIPSLKPNNLLILKGLNPYLILEFVQKCVKRNGGDRG